MAMEVQSASKFTQKAIDAPAAVSVVTAGDIRSFGYRTLADIIGSMRGVYVSQDRYFSYVGVRGFARAGDYNTRILLLVDGIRQNDAVYNQAMVGTESPIDVDLIDRVEFVPGAGSSVYGSNAFFGVINVITKRGNDYRGGELSGSVGSYGTGKARATYGSDGNGQGPEWLLSGSWYQQRGQDHYFPAYDNPATNGGWARGIDGDRSGSVFGKLQTENVTLGMSFGRRTKENPTASFGQAFGATGSQSTDEGASLSGEYRRAVSEKLDLTARAYVQQYRYEGNFIYDLPPLYTNRDTAKGTMWGGELQFSSTHFRNHRIVGGLEHRRDTGVHQRNFDVAPYTSYLDRRTGSNTTGIYAQDEYTINDYVLINAGLRRDQMSNFAGATSPRLALIVKPQPDTAVKLLYGEAYRVPNAFEMHYETNTASGYRTNPDLRPERIRSKELVVDHTLSPSQRIVGSIYRNDVRDLISQFYDAAADRFYFDNTARVEARGTELEWTARLAGGIAARASATWQRAEDIATGLRIVNSPARIGKLGISAPFWGERLRAGLEVQGMSARRTGNGEAAGFAVANLTLLAPRLARNLELSASVYNLFDRRYADPAGDELAPIDSVRQNGRNFRLKLSYRF